jgi:glycosyltransferase involved in cell wall biosynthesis
MIRGTLTSSPSGRDRPASVPAILLSVVVPVYNGGEEIVANVAAIREAVKGGLGEDDVEIIVVSDGSIDDTAERLIEARGAGMRVIHYDRNLGKGYAVKTGALAAHGEWIALVDSDLDVDPASIPAYLDVARSEKLDFAIGSKRHQESVVAYPRSRRIASWCYQQLNRLLFHLDVRDTQVGLKVFSRRVADDVIPVLLVKQFAFDLELLAVAQAFGYGRMKELPIRLEYRFTGSALGSMAVARALWDTAAIFYRLRVLHTYERKRHLVGRVPDTELRPLVSVVGEDVLRRLDYPRLEAASDFDSARGELVALVQSAARPAGNWVSAAVPYFADAAVAAVVTPNVAVLQGTTRARLAAAVLESRLGGGSRRTSNFPGNVGFIADYPADAIVARRADLLAAKTAAIGGDELVGWLAAQGRHTVYTPDSSVAISPLPFVGPHLRSTFGHGASRGRAARRTRGGSLSAATGRSLAPALACLVGVAFILVGGALRVPGLVLVSLYAAALLLSGVHAAFRFRSVVVGLLEPPAVVASQVAYVAGFVRGLLESTSSSR